MNKNDLPKLPRRPEDGHKGTFGRLLIIGGARGMAGAIALSGMAALRSGAGLVYLGVAESILGTVAAIEPSYLTIPLEEDDEGRLCSQAQKTLLERSKAMDSLAIGPGLGRSGELTNMVTEFYADSPLPMLIDADALNALAEKSEIYSQHQGPRVLTPHPGEFARLIGKPIEEINRHREEIATEFAAQHQVVLVLKGPGTIVTNGNELYVNTTGNSGLGTGGTGDVLTGIISSLMAQGVSPLEAAKLGVYAHGLAGDLAAEELTPRAMIASDVVTFLPAAWKKVESIQ